MECKDLYKLMRIPSVADALAKRSQNIIAERQEKRREFFWGSRVDLEAPLPVDKKKQSRGEMLQKWKAEKMKKLEEEKKKQKPVFKVGIVQRKVTGSPVLTQQKAYFKKTIMTQQAYKKPQKNQMIDSKIERNERTGILTRAKAKTMGVKVAVKTADTNPASKLQKGLNNKFWKFEGGKKKQIDSHVFKVPEVVTKLPCQGLTYPYSPKLIRRNEKTVKTVREVEVETTQQNININVIYKDKHLMENIREESIPQEVCLQPEVVTPAEKKTQEDDYQPIVYSPFVTVRSGRKSKRTSKKSFSIDVEEQIKKEENELKCRIFSFRKYIYCERKRLLEMCDKWKHIYQEFQEIPTNIEGDIDSVIGKTNLLTSDKFKQFEGLIDKCENGDPYIKIDDLQGFQDWVSIEVERINEEFHKLEKLKGNNWECETVHVDVTKPRKAKIPKNSSKKPVGNSNIRSHILAARKLLKEKNPNSGNEPNDLATLVHELSVNPVTPKNKGSLLKDVLNSETKKKNELSKNKSPAIRERRNSGLEIMIATQKNKFPTPIKLQKSPLLSDYEIFVGKEKTPSRSILKKTPKTSNSSKDHVKFKKHTENLVSGGRGLSEKYFQPLTDNDDFPIRTVLGDLGNITPGMMTRSRAKQLSFSPLISPRVK